MKTARQLFHDCKRFNVALRARGDSLDVRPLRGALAPDFIAELKAAKLELLALLKGNYMRAAAYLVLRYADSLDQQDALAERFDERAGICQYEGGLDRGEAEWKAYVELARHIEQEAK